MTGSWTPRASTRAGAATAWLDLGLAAASFAAAGVVTSLLAAPGGLSPLVALGVVALVAGTAALPGQVAVSRARELAGREHGHVEVSAEGVSRSVRGQPAVLRIPWEDVEQLDALPYLAPSGLGFRGLRIQRRSGPPLEVATGWMRDQHLGEFLRVAIECGTEAGEQLAAGLPPGEPESR